MRYRLRPVTDDDLPLLHRWLNDPGVVEWWEGDDVSWEGVVNDYGSGHGDPVEHWICLTSGSDDPDDPDAEWTAIGWIQSALVSDFAETAELWSAVDAMEGVVGIDYLIGEPTMRGRGAGSGMIVAFVDFLFSRPSPPPQIGADPVAGNVGSWRALEKAGFRLAGIVDDDEHGQCKIMLIDRPGSPSAEEPS